jgi:hypothetical protein
MTVLFLIYHTRLTTNSINLAPSATLSANVFPPITPGIAIFSITVNDFTQNGCCGINPICLFLKFARQSFVFTPHIGFYSVEALERILSTTVKNITTFSAGARAHLVNHPEPCI